MIATVLSALAIVCLHIPKAELHRRNVASSKLESLIDQLTSDQAIHETYLVEIGKAPTTEDGVVMGKQLPVMPAAEKLIRMGPRALPKLLLHLNDRRSTRWVMKKSAKGGEMWFSDEYDSRFPDVRKFPGHVSLALGFDPPKGQPILNHSYTACVGDVCYELAGQIVNRGLFVFRLWPGKGLAVNSPTHDPALAKAVRREWMGLTVTQHRAQLKKDVYSFWSDNPGGGMRDLLYYYQRSGERLVTRLLKTPIYDSGALIAFIDERFMQTDDSAAWRKALEEARKSFTLEEVKLIPYWVFYNYCISHLGHPPKNQDRARDLLKTIYPKFVPYKNDRCKILDSWTKTEIISATTGFPSKKIDRVVQQTFRDIKDWHPKSNYPHTQNPLSDQVDNMAIACLQRMIGKGFDQEYLAFLNRRVQEIPKTDFILEKIRRWIDRINHNSKFISSTNGANRLPNR